MKSVNSLAKNDLVCSRILDSRDEGWRVSEGNAKIWARDLGKGCGSWRERQKRLLCIYFSLRAKFWHSGGVGGQFPRNVKWSKEAALPLPSFLQFCFCVHAFSISRSRLSWSLEQDKNEPVIANWRGDISTILLRGLHVNPYKIGLDRIGA